MENKANTRSLYVSSLTDLSGKVAYVIRAETWTGHRATQSLLTSGAKVVTVTRMEKDVDELAKLHLGNLEVFRVLNVIEN